MQFESKKKQKIKNKTKIKRSFYQWRAPSGISEKQLPHTSHVFFMSGKRAAANADLGASSTGVKRGKTASGSKLPGPSAPVHAFFKGGVRDTTAPCKKAGSAQARKAALALAKNPEARERESVAKDVDSRVSKMWQEGKVFEDDRQYKDDPRDAEAARCRHLLTVCVLQYPCQHLLTVCVLQYPCQTDGMFSSICSLFDCVLGAGSSLRARTQPQWARQAW